MFKANDKVTNPQFGTGTIITVLPDSAIVRFENNTIQECPLTELQAAQNAQSALANVNSEHFDEVLAKAQAMLIESINNRWGVFSCSTIQLLPHQLWVCNQVLKEWPVRFLVADDVGLGKTIEAGLMISSLCSTGKAKRILILTPAPLTTQWQERMYTMFGLNFDVYTTENEKSKINYWEGHDCVIASFPTLEINNNSRQNKLLDSEAWDFVIVDEAHHMNAGAQSGKTLQYQLFEKMEKANKVISAVFFTGTPHRGFDYGFWSLMKLLNPDLFDPKLNNKQQYEVLSKYFIRNNKQNTVDMDGKKLFHEVHQHPVTFSYTPEETDFYNKMSQFIQQGKAYSLTREKKISSQIQLVLIALQKLASSSIAAVKSALITRKENLVKEQYTTIDEEEVVSDFLDALTSDKEDDMETAVKKPQDLNFYLMEDEIKNLEELISLSDKITHESRIDKIIEIIETKFPEDNVLFFTEYKKTQSLLMTALMRKWGPDCVTFINGDGALNNVIFPDGLKHKLSIARTEAADLFNSGKKRFLISTEAAGEGIDLQHNCHVLIHADLPWNPMRLHQRVGRINRLGQKKDVDVVTLRNPDTVESLIWQKLETKIQSINEAFKAGMSDPDDLMPLILGMQSNDYYTSLFTEGMTAGTNKSNFDSWFDSKTKTFGGQNAISTVTNIVGNASRFNLAGLPDVPKVDLPDLQSFFVRSIKLNGRQISWQNGLYSFKTPEEWAKNNYGIKTTYQDLFFNRKVPEGENPKNLCGVGNKVFNLCLKYADGLSFSASTVKGTKSYFIYKIFDRKTYSTERITSDYLFIEYDGKNGSTKKLNLDEGLKILNEAEKNNAKDGFLSYIPEKVVQMANEAKKTYSFTLPESELKIALCAQGEK